MSLKKYNELSDVEKEKVKVMYSDETTLQMYLYNFDDKGNYHGRQYAPPSGVDKKVGPYGVVHAESTVPDEPKPVEEDVEDKKPVEDVKETKTRRRTKKK